MKKLDKIQHKTEIWYSFQRLLVNLYKDVKNKNYTNLLLQIPKYLLKKKKIMNKKRNNMTILIKKISWKNNRKHVHLDIKEKWYIVNKKNIFEIDEIDSNDCLHLFDQNKSKDDHILQILYYQFIVHIFAKEWNVK